MVQGLYKEKHPICLDIAGAIDSKPVMSLRHEAFSQEWSFYTTENAYAQSEVEREITGFALTDSDKEWSDGSGSILDESEEISDDKPQVFSQDEERSESYEGSGYKIPGFKDLESEGSGSKESEEDKSSSTNPKEMIKSDKTSLSIKHKKTKKSLRPSKRYLDYVRLKP